MKILRAWLGVVPVLMLATGSASSHHAFSPVYDEKRLITVVGAVTEFRFINPHAIMLMDVTDESGRVAKWTDSAGLIRDRSEEHTSELQSHSDLVCRLLLEKKKKRSTTLF